MSFIDQVESWEVIVFLGCLLFLGVYFGRQMDLENMLKKDSPVPVHMNGQIRPSRALAQVEVLPIPAHVYASLETDKRFERYLTGNHKYVLMFTYPGCPYARAFTAAFKKLFSEDGFDEYYRKRVITVGQTTSVSCPGHRDMNCATAWVYQTCFGNLCILNPVQRAVVVDHSQSAQQIEALLNKYREW